MPLPTRRSASSPGGSSPSRGGGNLDDIADDLTREFLVDAVDTLAALGVDVSNAVAGTVDGAALLPRIRRETHNLKGLGKSFGFPAITAIAHRLENYMTDLDSVTARQLQDILPFLDRMQEIADSGRDPGDEALRRIVRLLPAKGAAQQDFEAASDLEILLVTSSRILGRAVEGELNQRGYRVVTVKSPLDVFETVIRTRPDLIIASAMMEGVSGVDLARALKAMRPTSAIRFALLTSFDASHPEFRQLPDDVALVHHDRDMDAELTGAFEKFGWTAG